VNDSQLPPHDRNAERGLLGSMIRENSIIVEVVDMISRDAFYLDSHQRIFGVIVELNSSGKPVDLVMLAERLKAAELIADIGGYPYLQELWECAPTAANAMFYANIVREKFLMRRMIHACNEILREVYSPVGAVDDLIENAQRQILAIGNEVSASENHKLADVIIEVHQEIDRNARSPSGVIGVPTGLIDIDMITGGFRDGELIILGARPSVGKSAMAGNIARNAAAEGFNTLVVSLEMPRVQWVSRWICGDAKVDSHSLRSGRLSHDQVERIQVASNNLSPLPIWLNDTPTQKTRNIMAAARRLKASNKLKFVIVDYLQLIDAEDRRVLRNEQVSAMTRALKLMARELELPVLCLSQLSRGSDQREDKRPRLSDLRDSGSIEQDADTVLFLHRPEKSDPSSETELIEFIIEKQRNGPLRTVPLEFRKATMRFENYAPGVPL
jgi:replicative DNA helicase